MSLNYKIVGILNEVTSAFGFLLAFFVHICKTDGLLTKLAAAPYRNETKRDVARMVLMVLVRYATEAQLTC